MVTIEDVKKLYPIGTVFNNSNLLPRKVSDDKITKDTVFYFSTDNNLGRGISVSIKRNNCPTTWTLYRFDTNEFANIILKNNTIQKVTLIKEINNYEIF
jgi:hypothetical protein